TQIIFRARVSLRSRQARRFYFRLKTGSNSHSPRSWTGKLSPLAKHAFRQSPLRDIRWKACVMTWTAALFLREIHCSSPELAGRTCERRSRSRGTEPNSSTARSKGCWHSHQQRSYSLVTHLVQWPSITSQSVTGWA